MDTPGSCRKSGSVDGIIRGLPDHGTVRSRPWFPRYSIPLNPVSTAGNPSQADAAGIPTADAKLTNAENIAFVAVTEWNGRCLNYGLGGFRRYACSEVFAGGTKVVQPGVPIGGRAMAFRNRWCPGVLDGASVTLNVGEA